MAAEFDCHDRARRLALELHELPRPERAAVLLDLVASLAAEASILIGREATSEAIYALADICATETRVRR